MNKLLILLSLLSISSCSNKMIYDGFRQALHNQCAEEPQSTYSDCMERANKTYEEYQNERNESE